MCLCRIYGLGNLASIHIQNVWIEDFQGLSLNTTERVLPPFYDAADGVLAAINLGTILWSKTFRLAIILSGMMIVL